MLMKKRYISLLVLLVFLCIQLSFAQELYVGANAELYLKKDLDFTTSNTLVSVNPLGKFSVEAGNIWGSATEYVNGNVYGYGSSLTKLPTGDNGIYAPVMATHTGDIFAKYLNAVPNSGTNGTDVLAVSDLEYWELTGNAIITLPYNPSSDITNLVNSNGGVPNSVAIVGYDSGEWNLVSAPLSNVVTGDLQNGTVTSDPGTEVILDNFGQFTFGIDNQTVLGIDDFFTITGINILSNPINPVENIRFTSQVIDNIDVTLYDMTGKTLRYYQDIDILNGIGTIQSSHLKSGVYVLKFQHDGKQAVKKIIIE